MNIGKLLFIPRDLLFSTLSIFVPLKRSKQLSSDRIRIMAQARHMDYAFQLRKELTFLPVSLNIFKEIESDLGISRPESGDLTRWAKQGVLLLNATLTVRAHQAGSHQKKGWEEFTDYVIRVLNSEKKNLVFFLWGAYAQKKGESIDRSRHLVLESVHPSPLSASRGFFGNRHFSRCNDYLISSGIEPVDWR